MARCNKQVQLINVSKKKRERGIGFLQRIIKNQEKREIRGK